MDGSKFHPPPAPPAARRFLFLQGPISPFFPELGAALAARGHAVHRINLCLGDRLIWRGPETVDFRGRLRDWPDFIEAFLDAHGITDIVLTGEQRLYHRVAIAAAAERRIAVIATDYGYLRPDWVILERDGHNALSHYPRDRAGILALGEGAPPLGESRAFADAFPRQAFWDVAYHLSNLLPGRFRHFETHVPHAVIPAYLGMGWRLVRRAARQRHAEALVAGLPEDAPLYLFAMQMEMDFSLRAYSPYDDLDTPMREAVASFAAHAPANAHLAFKVHPLDTGLKHWPKRVARMARRAGVAGRVHLLDGGRLDALILRSAGLLTVNSTAALRALQLGKPVLALGEAIYQAEGLHHDQGLDSFWTGAHPPEPALAEAFLRGLARHLHVRGGFYDHAARAAAVAAAADRLAEGRVGVAAELLPAA
jgi:capsular polysaccharide export protein